MERSMPTQLSRDAWTDAALEVLTDAGLEAVRVERLARRLRVTKGSFYWHFRDRAALFEAMLARWEQVATTAIADEVEAKGGPPGARLRRLFAIALAVRPIPLDAAIRQWAGQDPRVRRAVVRVDDRRMGYLRMLFEGLGFAPLEAHARSFIAYSLLFGDHFIAARETRRARAEVLERCTALMVPARRGRK
jgi:AcrR family transcriptional regulator